MVVFFYLYAISAQTHLLVCICRRRKLIVVDQNEYPPLIASITQFHGLEKKKFIVVDQNEYRVDGGYSFCRNE